MTTREQIEKVIKKFLDYAEKECPECLDKCCAIFKKCCANCCGDKGDECCE